MALRVSLVYGAPLRLILDRTIIPDEPTDYFKFLGMTFAPWALKTHIEKTYGLEVFGWERCPPKSGLPFVGKPLIQYWSDDNTPILLWETSLQSDRIYDLAQARAPITDKLAKLGFDPRDLRIRIIIDGEVVPVEENEDGGLVIVERPHND